MPARDRRALRCASKDDQQLVDSCAIKLRFSKEAPYQPCAQERYPAVTSVGFDDSEDDSCHDYALHDSMAALEAGRQPVAWGGVRSLQLLELPSRCIQLAVSVAPMPRSWWLPAYL